MPLTDRAIRNLKPANKGLRIFDGGGTYMEIAPSGGKGWRLKYRVGGKEKRVSLGVYPGVSLADARNRRDAARKLLAAGTDPARNAERIGARPRDALQTASRQRRASGTASKAGLPSTVEAKIAGRQAASRYLKALVDVGVLREQSSGKEKLFLHSKLLALLAEEGNLSDPY